MDPTEIDLEELIRLYGEGERDFTFQYFLDQETGEVVYWSDPDYGEENEVEIEELDASDRYLYFPKEETSEAWEDMSAFVDTISDDDLRRQLRRGIDGRGAFRMFKEILSDNPEERERWFAFRYRRRRERVLQWLRQNGIEVDPERLDEKGE